MKTRKTVPISKLSVYRQRVQRALPAVRQLAAKHDLTIVNAAVKVLYDERKANKDLRAAEARVEQLKRTLGV